MLRLEPSGKKLIRLPSSVPTEERDFFEFILNSPEAFFSEIGETLFLAGRNVRPAGSAGTQADLLALDREGNSVIVIFQRDKPESALHAAILCAGLIAQWKAADFVAEIEKQRSGSVPSLLSADPSRINHGQRVILVAKEHSHEILATAKWLSHNHGIDISCVQVSLFWDAEVRQAYLACQSLLPDVLTRPTSEAVEQPDNRQVLSERISEVVEGEIPSGRVTENKQPKPAAFLRDLAQRAPRGAKWGVAAMLGVVVGLMAGSAIFSPSEPKQTLRQTQLASEATPAGPPVEARNALAVVTGVVQDSATRRAIANAKLHYAGERYTTGPGGDFEFPFQPGYEQILVRAAGYRQREASITNNLVVITLEPLQVRAIYLNPIDMEDSEAYETVQGLINRGSVNALVLTVKSPEGRLGLPVQHEMAGEIGAVGYWSERPLAAKVKRWKEKGIYMIAHVAAFRDDLLAKEKPQLALRSLPAKQPIGEPDSRGWTDPSLPLVRNYNISVAKAAALAGFDEIQFDSVLYPGTGSGTQGVDPQQTEQRLSTLVKFLRRASTELAAYNVYVSANVLSSICSVREVNLAGQRLEDFAQAVDYVCPMFYPAAFSPNRSYPNQVELPYELILEHLTEASIRLGGNSEKLRPWLQNFPASGPLGAEMIQLQIKAAVDAHSNGWMLWDREGLYHNTVEALAPSLAENP